MNGGGAGPPVLTFERRAAPAGPAAFLPGPLALPAEGGAVTIRPGPMQHRYWKLELRSGAAQVDCRLLRVAERGPRQVLEQAPVDGVDVVCQVPHQALVDRRQQLVGEVVEVVVQAGRQQEIGEVAAIGCQRVRVGFATVARREFAGELLQRQRDRHRALRPRSSALRQRRGATVGGRVVGFAREVRLEGRPREGVPVRIRTAAAAADATP